MPDMSDDAARLRALRHEVRQFVDEQIMASSFEVTADSWLSGWDPNFSQALAARGWVGMTIPEDLGGRGRSYAERFVVTEELLAVGAPVAAHWVADRQIAPSLLRHGTREQQERFLPEIASGRCYFAIGMSEPDAGSDLAAVRTKAVRVDGGWQLDGSKVWTSNAHRAHAFIALVRTTPREQSSRHDGLTQFIVHLDSPGVDVRPIQSLDGESHFNEVVFDGVFVPDADLLGVVGAGWSQVTSELGFERSGPERFLSTFPALARLVNMIRAGESDLIRGSVGASPVSQDCTSCPPTFLACFRMGDRLTWRRAWSRSWERSTRAISRISWLSTRPQDPRPATRRSESWPRSACCGGRASRYVVAPTRSCAG